MDDFALSSSLQFLAEVLDLGHKARTEAVLRQVERTVMTAQAGALAPGLPWAEAMAFYRFAGNEEIPLAKLREARRDLTLRAMDPAKPVLVIHDVTLLDYSPHNAKKDRRAIGDHRGRGYEYVNVAAFDAQTGHFFGVLHDTVVDESGPDDAAQMDYDYDPLFKDFDEAGKKRLRENHRHQMAVHVRHLAPVLAPFKTIHVADREFDDIFILHEAASAGSHILVRCMAPRNVQMHAAPWIPESAHTEKQQGHRCPAGMICVNMESAVPALPLAPYKTVHLDRNGRVATKEAPGGRTAHLGIGACPVRLYRTAKRNKARYYRTPSPVELNMVVIREQEPPNDVQPLCWILFTTLPTDNLAEQKAVGSHYEKRWNIEEHHRLLKSGYKVERSRLSDASKIARLLAVTTIAAAIVLHLRNRLALPAKGKLDNASHEKLNKAMREPDNPQIDASLRLYALAARLGGWLGRRSDPIGPETIMRGIARIGQMLSVLNDAAGLIAELQEGGVLERIRASSKKCV